MGSLQVYQLFEKESSTYTYLIFDPQSREAAIIDPVRETLDRDLKLIQELGVKLCWILDTHVHADHVTAAGRIREITGAKTGVSAQAKVICVDQPLKDGDELPLGSFRIKVLETPGHTDGCLSYYVDGNVFTGDALLIRGCGRTDFQQGNPEKLFHSIKNKIYTLPDETVVFPGHDYRGFTRSTVGEEKKFNSRIRMETSLQEFVKTMRELKLPDPAKIAEAVPANLMCGKTEKPTLQPQLVDGIKEVTPQDVKHHLGDIRIIDVRTPEEFVGELGHIPGAQLVTLGPDLQRFLETNPQKDVWMVFVCRSGGRSGQATRLAQSLGYQNVMNMQGGMLAWNSLGYEVVR